MKIKVLHKGDTVINVTQEFVAVKRKNGEVDIIGLQKDEFGWRIDMENIVTIGYGDNIVETKNENGITITTF